MTFAALVTRGEFRLEAVALQSALRFRDADSAEHAVVLCNDWCADSPNAPHFLAVVVREPLLANALQFVVERLAPVVA